MQDCPSVAGKLGQLSCRKEPWAFTCTHLAPLDGQREAQNPIWFNVYMCQWSSLIQDAWD